MRNSFDFVLVMIVGIIIGYIMGPYFHDKDIVRECTNKGEFTTLFTGIALKCSKE